MHLGNVYSALLSYLSAKSRGGKWLLRIEDLDPQRSKPEYVDLLKDDLLWLGLEWDLYCVQSERFALYEEHLRRLTDMGLTYPCYCTRADIMATQAPHESDGRIVYAGTCRPRTDTLTNLQISDRPAATRLIVPDREIRFTDRHYGEQSVNLAKHCGDFVVRRADGAWAYQLAVVVDDALMGVTEVVRGSDLLLSSAQQIYLYEILGYPVPEFCHLPLLCNEAGQRLSKRDKSLDMASIRERYTPEQLLGILAHAAGQTPNPSPISLSRLTEIFTWDKVPTENIVFRL